MTLAPSERVRWTTADLELLPENSNRYEIIDGVLFVTRAPHLKHQDVAGRLYAQLLPWSLESRLGMPYLAPGIIFSEADNVIPDLIWVSHERLEQLLDSAGHLAGAPELVIEVLSESEKDKKRDRETKLKLYSTQGVLEYWILEREQKAIEIYRREAGILKRVMTLFVGDLLTSPLLPEFSCSIGEIFED